MCDKVGGGRNRAKVGRGHMRRDTQGKTVTRVRESGVKGDGEMEANS